MFEPTKKAEDYMHLTTNAALNPQLTPMEQCVVMKAYDYGLADLDDAEVDHLNAVIAKLKDQIWP